MPTIGIEGGRINIVPVDFVVNAMDHIMHLEKGDGRAYHLTDPEPHRVGDVLNIFCKAALFGFIPRGIKKSIMSLTPARRVRNAVMKDLGLPDEIMQFVNYPTRFDSRDTEKPSKAAASPVPI